MYNRYIPQPDGSYLRSRVSERPREKPAAPVEAQEPLPPPPAAQAHTPSPPKREAPRPSRPQKHESRPDPQNKNVAAFLRQLLPQNFDTGDLMVVLLLLLMSENSKDGQNTALLTLVIYLFL